MVASLDSSALEALASKGLLRRAKKDFDRDSRIAIKGVEAGCLRISLDQYEVRMPEAGPVMATCSCPAPGICQHILTAVLYLQQTLRRAEERTQPSLESVEEVDAMQKEWLEITPEQLQRWSGKGVFRAGLKIANQYSANISPGKGICVRFPALNAECRFVPGGGLDGAISTVSKIDDRELVVAAVIAFQKAKGKTWTVAVDSVALEASDGSPRSRSEVLHACQTLLQETLVNGLAHLSTSHHQRWVTLAVSALGVNLPRLALVLRSIADETMLVLTRDARSDLGRMLGRMAETHALCAAIENGGDIPRADLVGWHRIRYDEMGHLDLAGVAAWPWCTASGYEGLTVLFWEGASQRWNTWTESRPRQYMAGFDAIARYTQPGPWEGAESPRQLARSSFRLMNAKRNAMFRLSASSRSRAMVTGPSELSRMPVFTDWVELTEHLHRQTSVGLKQADLLQSIVAIKPTAWGERMFDPILQTLTWLLEDAQQRGLLLELRFDELNEPAIKYLEAVPLKSLADAVMIGRAVRTTEGLRFQPYSMHRPTLDVTHLALDPLAGNSLALAVANSEEDKEEIETPAEEEELSATLDDNAITSLLNEVDDALLALAEAGMSAKNALRYERLRPLSVRANRQNLIALSTTLKPLVASIRSPFDLLRCRYVVGCHRQAALIG